MCPAYAPFLCFRGHLFFFLASFTDIDCHAPPLALVFRLAAFQGKTKRARFPVLFFPASMFAFHQKFAAVCMIITQHLWRQRRKESALFHECQHIVQPDHILRPQLDRVTRVARAAVNIVVYRLSLIHISEPTRQAEISYAVFCLKKKKKKPPIHKKKNT